MADVISQDKVDTGLDRGTLYYSMLTLTARMGLALSVGLIYPVPGWIGFDPSGGNDADTLNTVRILVATSPTVLLFLTAMIMFHLPVNTPHKRRVP